MTISYSTEPEPTRARAELLLPGIRRIVANNPGPLTYHGTNTYLLDHAEGTVVIDPGPAEDSAHIDAILAATPAQITKILLTHAHRDHIGALDALVAKTGATTYAFRYPVEQGFQPDVSLADGDIVAGLDVLYTPGHCSDHLCFARRDGIVFTGDHVMGWSSSFVAAPDGSMAQYLSSLARLLARDDNCYLAAHGPALYDPRAYVSELVELRRRKEASILDALRSFPPISIEDLLRISYPKAVDPRIRRAAQRTLLAHLIKLKDDGTAQLIDDLWSIRR
ncbi:MBL fold metallo-hydrolase [Ralstonia soli]|uniref:MBL fold metallo-hydrolase n=1 Tax=Ralstonia soli TaxID=2953896 RepID=A0ABT1AMS5_9RALS|nr:MBL fold metallo-hydrolase [Ralstonia soli]MCO5399713.1 MBL fold metallo-hydrolase [Ralstonia soli]